MEAETRCSDFAHLLQGASEETLVLAVLESEFGVLRSRTVQP